MVRRNYHPVSIALHWLMFLLFAAALLFIEIRGDVPKGEPLRNWLLSWHMDAGLLVLMFALLRVVARLSFGGPRPIGPRIQAAAASALHGLLYLVLFLLPITGVVFSQAGGRDVALFGWVLPHLVAPDPALRTSVREVHEFLGNAVYFLVGIHALAALWHHVMLKDDTLRRMTFKHRD